MIRLVLLAVVLSGCYNIEPASGPEFSQESYGTFEPIQPNFGYNPDYAKQLHELPPDFRFYNFNPDKFEGQARTALGNFITMTNLEFKIPANVYTILQYLDGDYSQVISYGGIPSPFDYQNNAAVKSGNKTLPVTLPLGIGLTQSAVSGQHYATLNCLTCHATVIGHRAVIGTYNIHRASDLISRYMIQDLDINESLLSAGLTMYSTLKGKPQLVTASLIEEDKRVIRNLSHMKSVVFDNIYTDLGNISNMAHNDAAASGLLPTFMINDMDTWDYDSDHYHDFLAARNALGRIPVNVPSAWWLARYRGHYTTKRWDDTRSSFVALWTAFFSAPPMGTTDHMKWPERYKKMEAVADFMDQIESPPFPKDIDLRKANAGYPLYEKHCAGCHGSFRQAGDGYVLGYDKDASWIPIEKIGIARDMLETNKAIGHIRDSLMELPEYKNAGNEILLQDVCVEAPPLVGLWATAPYLHNHSVPTVYQVLNSAARHKVWKQDEDRFAYDYKDLGIKHTEVIGPYKESRYIYDTTIRSLGQSNKGHTFGDKLTDAERYAIIEFLKTLTTKNVTPNPYGETICDEKSSN